MRTRRRIAALCLAAGLMAGLPGPAAAAELSPAEVAELERLLARLNFDPGEIDSVADERTRTAIRLYQEFAALTPDGEPTADLLAELRAVVQAFQEMKAAKAEQERQDEEQAAKAAEEARAAEREAEEARAAEREAEEARAAEREAEEARAAEQAAAEAAKAAEEAQAAEQERLAREQAAREGEEVRAAEQAAEQAAAEAAKAAEEAQAAEQERLAREQAAKEAEEARAAEQAAQAAAEAAKAAEQERLARKAEEARAAEQERLAAEQAAKAAEQAARAQPAPEPAPAGPPPKPKARPGFDLDGMISRLTRGERKAAPAPEPAPPAPKKNEDEQSSLGNSRGESGGSRGLKLKLPPAVQSAAKLPAGLAPGGDGYATFKNGYAAARSGKLDLAIELYTRAIDTGDLKLEHLAGALYNRANAHHYLGALKFAIQDYSAAILNKPDFPGAYYNRGFAFQANGQRTRALADFMKARKLGLQRLGVRSPDLLPPLP